jgi:hypothetical protein
MTVSSWFLLRPLGTGGGADVYRRLLIVRLRVFRLKIMRQMGAIVNRAR